MNFCGLTLKNNSFTSEKLCKIVSKKFVKIFGDKRGRKTSAELEKFAKNVFPNVLVWSYYQLILDFYNTGVLAYKAMVLTEPRTLHEWVRSGIDKGTKDRLFAVKAMNAGDVFPFSDQHWYLRQRGKLNLKFPKLKLQDDVDPEIVRKIHDFLEKVDKDAPMQLCHGWFKDAVIPLLRSKGIVYQDESLERFDLIIKCDAVEKDAPHKHLRINPMKAFCVTEGILENFYGNIKFILRL